MAKTTDEIKQQLTRKRYKPVIPESDFISTGSTVLNLACTGRPKCGFAKGKYYFVVGDSSAGKTWLSMSFLAEAAYNNHFADHLLIHDNAEDGALMNVERYFGKLAERLKAPAYDVDGEPIYSATVEQFYDTLTGLIAKKKPFIYILDSMDVLTCEAELEKEKKQRAARTRGTTEAGTYGLDKAKQNSTKLRKVISGLKATGSILMIISQTRDNIGFGFEKKTRAGGNALRFYATLELWLSIKGKMRIKRDDRNYVVGQETQIDVKKNRITGEDCKILVPILKRHGIDDVGGCIEFLVDNGFWKVTAGRLAAPEFEFSGRLVKLIEHVEADETGELFTDLQNLVYHQWRENETRSTLPRKKRYE